MRDARRITGRNSKTGEKENGFLTSDKEVLNPNSHIGLINYLLILDMIGIIFKENGAKPEGGKIFCALSSFSSLPKPEIHAIVALRNSLAHNYGLVNLPRKSEKFYEERKHKFILDNTEQASLVCFPQVPWDGQFSTKTEDQSTTVGTIALMDIVEDVYRTLLSKLEKGTATLNLAGSIDELNSRFTILY